MTINLTSGSPTSDATDLTAGANYSIFHRGPVRMQVSVDSTWMTVYEVNGSGSIVVLGIPTTSLRFALASGDTAAEIELTKLA